MIEAGHFLLIVALALGLFQAVVPLVGVLSDDRRMAASARPVAVLVFVLTALAFAALVYAYVISDFSVLNVVQNSHSEKPLLYKITGVWSNHEGSMMLWLLILTFFTMLFTVFAKHLPARPVALAIAVQGMIATAFTGFILFTSNPYLRLDPPALQGRGPLKLETPRTHPCPPLLYLGYVGFSLCFSLTMAALILGRVDAAFGRWLRPWALVSWVFLTGGITLGSYWAYYELGWGGYWFWDPVENASLIPWLMGTALLHSAIVLEKRGSLKIWTLLLAIITFSFSLLGTFLVRSGILTSVHSFASSPQRGIVILGLLAAFIGGALFLFALRAPAIRDSGHFRPLSREGALVLNNLLLGTAAAAVLVGTLYPLVLDMLTGAKISVGAPFFNITVGALVLPLLVLVPFGPLLGWKKGDIAAACGRLWPALAVAVLTAGFVLYLVQAREFVAVVLLALAAWVICGALCELFVRSGGAGTSLPNRLQRLWQLPTGFWGTAFAHAGIGVTLLGIITVATFGEERIAVLAPQEHIEINGRQLVFERYGAAEGANYYDTQLYFTLKNGMVPVGSVVAGRRTFPTQSIQTSEAGLLWRGLSQYYVAAGDSRGSNKTVVSVWWKPAVLCIWLGGFLMMAGGVCSLYDRRLRHKRQGGAA
ncbi:MAG: Cytochrome c-type biogenesis protein CcmF [Candidatus Tokpelaia hoelldobleri]|uniref:Cytochrome c-type biogenesis protein CcmF n=1 Tax=Candidatus Tokpelaia hoelldobleri TaxID=1902579 RepID=A0A1U9JVY1_9HYPH|nr:MAG: Cytochrome c-type biogenesis protein CcmF [Candidatus Tokpelaia hoelldoblerii]